MAIVKQCSRQCSAFAPHWLPAMILDIFTVVRRETGKE